MRFISINLQLSRARHVPRMLRALQQGENEARFLPRRRSLEWETGQSSLPLRGAVLDGRPAGPSRTSVRAVLRMPFNRWVTEAQGDEATRPSHLGGWHFHSCTAACPGVLQAWLRMTWTGGGHRQQSPCVMNCPTV